jgi:hypothetical protein
MLRTEQNETICREIQMKQYIRLRPTGYILSYTVQYPNLSTSLQNGGIVLENNKSKIDVLFAVLNHDMGKWR